MTIAFPWPEDYDDPTLGQLATLLRGGDLVIGRLSTLPCRAQLKLPSGGAGADGGGVP